MREKGKIGGEQPHLYVPQLSYPTLLCLRQAPGCETVGRRRSLRLLGNNLAPKRLRALCLEQTARRRAVEEALFSSSSLLLLRVLCQTLSTSVHLNSTSKQNVEALPHTEGGGGRGGEENSGKSVGQRTRRNKET